jgi:hypothetical protein
LCAFTATFNPAGVQHETVIGPSGASFFTIELRGQRLKDLGVRLPAQTKSDRGSGAMLLPGLRMYLAHKTQTSDAVLLESDVLELLAAIAGFLWGENCTQVAGPREGTRRALISRFGETLAPHALDAPPPRPPDRTS